MRYHLKTSYDHDIRLFPDRRRALRYAALVALGIALPFLLDDFLIGEVTNVLIWAIAGMGLMVLTGHAGQAINIARDWVTEAFGGGGLAVPGIEAGIFGLILILILLFEPHGIHGRLMKWKVWFELFPFYRRDMFRRQKRYLKTERLR